MNGVLYDEAKEKGSGGAMAKDLIEKAKSLDFLLFRLKVMQPSLTALGKSFQSGAIKVSKIVLNVLKITAKFRKLFGNGKKPLIYWKMIYRQD